MSHDTFSVLFSGPAVVPPGQMGDLFQAFASFDRWLSTYEEGVVCCMLKRIEVSPKRITHEHKPDEDGIEFDLSFSVPIPLHGAQDVLLEPRYWSAAVPLGSPQRDLNEALRATVKKAVTEMKKDFANVFVPEHRR